MSGLKAITWSLMQNMGAPTLTQPAQPYSRTAVQIMNSEGKNAAGLNVARLSQFSKKITPQVYIFLFIVQFLNLVMKTTSSPRII